MSAIQRVRQKNEKFSAFFKVGLYGIRLFRILCDATPAVMLSPHGYVRTMPIFE